MRGTRLLAALVGFSVALLLVARTTGAGWTIVVVCCVAASIVIGCVWPLVVVRRASVAVDGPADAVAGRPVAMRVTLAGLPAPVRVRTIDPLSEMVAASAPARGELQLTPARRGVVERVVVEVDCGAPLGLAWCRRRITVPLERALHVAPAPIEEPRAAAALMARGVAEAVRSIREYVPGDAARLVHWPATARRGELVVKELEEPERPSLVLRVVLPADGRAEEIASRAMGAALGALRAGVPVTLLTAERDGPQGGPVRSPIDAGRRLARAVAGTPAVGPVPPGAVVLTIGDA